MVYQVLGAHGAIEVAINVIAFQHTVVIVPPSGSVGM
jgi:hypothetical protein